MISCVLPAREQRHNDADAEYVHLKIIDMIHKYAFFR